MPFTFLPHEGGEGTPPPPPKPKTRVEPLAEREAEFAISWPNALRIEYKPILHGSVSLLTRSPVLNLSRIQHHHSRRIGPYHGRETRHHEAIRDRPLEELGRQFRLQKIVFETARDVYDQMKPKWIGNKDYLLAQVIRLVERVLPFRPYPDFFRSSIKMTPPPTIMLTET